MENPPGLLQFLGILCGVAALAVAIPLWFRWRRTQLEDALEQYCRRHQVKIELKSIVMPPLKYCLYNRNGDIWGRVVAEDGRDQWVRVRPGLFFFDRTLTFFDP